MAWHPEIKKVVKSELARQRRLLAEHRRRNQTNQVETTARKVTGLENALRTQGKFDDFARLALKERLGRIDEESLMRHRKLEKESMSLEERENRVRKIFALMVKKKEPIEDALL
ncbi:TPA: hypothetical protein HA244_04740 [Candidatus Micrarchaeota archaeon]|nr:hypothetical protein [Candidatus Micrarchaeota archaeon]